MCVFFAHLPLFSRAELPYCREAPSFVSVVFCHVLVCSQLHLEVKLCFIWLSQIISSRDQMLKLCRITSIVKIKDTRGIIALSGLSPLKNLIKQRWSSNITFISTHPCFLALSGSLSDVSIIGAYIGVSSEASKFSSLGELPFELVSFFDRFLKLFIPVCDIIIVEWRRIWNSFNGFWHVVFGTLIILSSHMPSLKLIWLDRFGVISQRINKW